MFWDPEQEDCALNLVVEKLADIACVLEDIFEVMPTATQLRSSKW
jgi:hypothetical protein